MAVANSRKCRRPQSRRLMRTRPHSGPHVRYQLATAGNFCRGHPDQPPIKMPCCALPHIARITARFHKHPEVMLWLEKHRRSVFHFHPDIRFLASLPNSQRSVSNAEFSDPCGNSKMPSTASSTTPMQTQNPLPGPRTQTKSPPLIRLAPGHASASVLLSTFKDRLERLGVFPFRMKRGRPSRDRARKRIGSTSDAPPIKCRRRRMSRCARLAARSPASLPASQ